MPTDLSLHCPNHDGGIGGCAVSITSARYFSLRSVRTFPAIVRAAAGHNTCYKRHPSWLFRVYTFTPPDNVTSRICCAGINPLRHVFNVVIVASPSGSQQCFVARGDHQHIGGADS